MSEEALAYVKQWARSPAARGVKMAERSVLRAVALMFSATAGYCYAPAEKIAEEAMIGGATADVRERQVRRSIAILEGKGLVRRHVSVRSRDRSQTTNLYELPGMADWNVAEGADTALQALPRPVRGSEEENTAEERKFRQVFKIARERVMTDGPMQLALERKRRPNTWRAPVVAAVENVSLCPPLPGQQETGPPGQQVSSLDVVFEVDVEDNPTSTPTPAAGKVQNAAWKAKSREATATAAATATTGAGAEAEGTTERRARRSESLARARTAGAANGFEPQADSAEAMVHDAATRVLMACGISPETSTRRLRAAVEEALRLRCEQTRGRDEPGSLGDAEALAIRRWREYNRWAGQDLLRYVVGVRKFFAEGLWLNPAVWPVDRAEEARRGRL